MTVFVSNKQIYTQIIDDKKGHTLVAASSKDIAKNGGKDMQTAQELGKLLGKRAGEKKIKEVVFDRGGRRYHGRLRVLAEAVRAQGINF